MKTPIWSTVIGYVCKANSGNRISINLKDISKWTDQIRHIVNKGTDIVYFAGVEARKALDDR